LNLELQNFFSKIASLQSVHHDMSAKPSDNCKMIMVKYADLWLEHTHVASQLKCGKLELRELKTHSLLLGACTSCPLLRSDSEASAVEIKDLKHKLGHPSRYSVLSPPCETCGSVKGKLFHATKENTELKQEVAYLIAHLEKTKLSKKMIEDDLCRVDVSATKTTCKLVVGFERCEDMGGKSAPNFIPSSNYLKEEATIKSNKTHYPSNPKPSFNPKREVRKETPKPREEGFVCMFCGCVGHMDGFASGIRESRRGTWIMLATHIVMSSLIFSLVLTLVLHLALPLELCLVSLMDLTITHMVLVLEAIALCQDGLTTAHILIVVIISCVGMVQLLESLTPALSPGTWTVHIFSVVVLIPLV
jgi:hypothetical protein